MQAECTQAPFLHHAPRPISIRRTFTSPVPAALSCGLAKLESSIMKSIRLALASILATTTAAWSAPAPVTLTHSQLVEIVRHATDDPRTLKDLAGAHIVIDLRPGTTHFVAAEDRHGLAFTCQDGFENFGGGPVTATVVKYEPGENNRDYVALGACTPQER